MIEREYDELQENHEWYRENK